jgi:uncharacterized secreted protein with C-terminal beta-propeller domain
MESEIRKRIKVYAVAAVLLAVILGSVCYNLGFIPESPIPQTSFLKTFASYVELKSFLTSNSKGQVTALPFYVGPGNRLTILSPSGFKISSRVSQTGDLVPLNGAIPQSVEDALPRFADNEEYSTTNVQVAGVDEADIVKNDGEYIYVASGNTVFIVNASQSDAGILSKIVCDDFDPSGIFVNGNRLVVLGSNYSMSSIMPCQILEVRTYARLYDVSDKANPVPLRAFTMTGGYFSSRMIGKYVYFVTSQPAYVLYDTVIVPKIYSNQDVKEIPASQIHYSNVSDDCFSFTTFVTMNVQDPSEEPTHTTIMMGATSNMYVSLSNIYVTFRETFGETTIYRVHMQDNNLTCVAQGKVPGNELNQYSMDEYGEYFRIATTSWTEGFQYNSLYVLNMNLSIVGNLTITLGENFHAARFMGDRCYLVTFNNTDPLFVISLTDPTFPKILGELNIPGYSDYLHPYDENHLIGVGKETVEAEGGNFAWYQGIKISIFDVTNVSNPVQMSSITIGDRGSDSPVLTDPKAFLFDEEKDLLVIPVTVAKVDTSQYPYGEVPSYAYGTPVWQGAYVYNVTLTYGLAPRGKITHGENIGLPPSNLYVNRSLYIGNVLYTVSEGKIKLNSLVDLALLKEVTLD